MCPKDCKNHRIGRDEGEGKQEKVLKLGAAGYRHLVLIRQDQTMCGASQNPFLLCCPIKMQEISKKEPGAVQLLIQYHSSNVIAKFQRRILTSGCHQS